eukprot:16448279-Heterocapsa_arctica.AAC.2
MIDYKGRMEDSLQSQEIQFREYKNKSAEALRAQRDESRKAHLESRASYEEQILNMNLTSLRTVLVVLNWLALTKVSKAMLL